MKKPRPVVGSMEFSDLPETVQAILFDMDEAVPGDEPVVMVAFLSSMIQTAQERAAFARKEAGDPRMARLWDDIAKAMTRCTDNIETMRY